MDALQIRTPWIRTKKTAGKNEISLVNGLRLVSAYHLNYGTKIWMITEADFSANDVCIAGRLLTVDGVTKYQNRPESQIGALNDAEVLCNRHAPGL